MLKMLHRAEALLLSCCLVAALLAGCAGESTAVSSAVAESPAASQSGADGATEAPGEGHPVSAEPITLRVLSETRADITLGNDMPVFRELEERTNVHLEWELLPIDLAEKNTKFNVVMASGDIPDLVHRGEANDVNRYGMQGLFLPLGDLIEEYAPNIKAAFDNPLPDDELPYELNTWGEITAADGNIYTIPLISSSNAIGAVWAIRTDWLEGLGLEVPTNADELYTVLKAFKEQDPNGNGETDEIPFGAAAGAKEPTITPLVNAFGAHMDLYVDEATGTIQYGPVEDSYKEALQYLNRLYSEGLLEADYLTATRDQWLARAGGNQMGLMFAWPGSGIGVVNTELQKLDENYRFSAIKPFVTASGQQYKDTKTAGNAVMYRTSVSANTKYPVEVIKYLDYCFSEEGTILCLYALEGEHYNMVDGKPVYTDYILENPDGLDPETARLQLGINWQLLPYQKGWNSEYQAMEKTGPWTIQAWDTYKSAGMVEAPMPTLGLSEDELSRRSSIIAEIETYRDPMINKFIMGDEPIEEKFEEFVEGINRSGLEELLGMLNSAYDVYKANSK